MTNLKEVPQMPYKIAEYLIESADENFWKILYYRDVDAVFKEPLTKAQKSNLIWIDQPQEQCNIFFSRMVKDAIPESKTIIKIYNGIMTPRDAHTCSVLWTFEFLWGGDLSIVYDEDGIPCNRGDLLMQYFMSCINGKYIGGVGDISFDTRIYRYTNSQSLMGNSKTYTGHAINIPVVVGSGNSECQC